MGWAEVLLGSVWGEGPAPRDEEGTGLSLPGVLDRQTPAGDACPGQAHSCPAEPWRGVQLLERSSLGPLWCAGAWWGTQVWGDAVVLHMPPCCCQQLVWFLVVFHISRALLL